MRVSTIFAPEGAATIATRAYQPHLGRDDEIQKISFARRYVAEVPASDLVEVAGKDIPVEDSPHEIAGTMLEHFAAR